MAARIDPFVEVLLREGGDQLYLLPDEPVTMLKDGKPRKVSRQPLTDKHIYALLVEVAPSEAADHIDKMAETEFVYIADRGMVRVRIVPELGRLTAVVAPANPGAEPVAPAAAAARAPAPAARRPSGATAAPPAPAAQRAPAVAGGHAAAPAASHQPPAGLPMDFAASQYQGAERALGELLKALVSSASSDLHLRVAEPPVFRTHGEMKRQSTAPLSPEQLELMLLSVMPERNRSEWKETGDSDFAYEIRGLARFRVNAARDRKGPMAVFRVIPAQVVTVEQLGITKEVQQLCYLTKGLVLVTGPTGSGKSTTLCSLVDLVNRMRTDSFKSALRAALREDPDIVLVGEMRDLETIAIAIETAETGHLVFGTLHTTTAASTVDRIIDQFPADRQAQIRVMLSESLKGVVSQTLCKKTGGGRVAAREILLTTPAIANLIREGKTFQIPSIIQTSKKLGMLTLNDALLELVEKKVIEPDEAYMRSVEKAGLSASLKAKGFKVTLTAEG